MVPCVVCRVSCVVCRVPCAMCRVPCAVCRVPCAVCRVPCVVCRVSCVVCRGSRRYRNAVAFWKTPFRSISSASQLIEYTVIDVTPTGKTRGRWLLAEVEVARSSDFGTNDTTFHTHTHLGSLLHPGDLALGYDVHTSNFNDDDLAALSLKGRSLALPDVVLVKKIFPNRKSKHKKRVSLLLLILCGMWCGMWWIR